jgi:choline kinase
MIALVVLAAGRGQRLGTLGEDTPKWLLEVDGTTIAERQLDAVARAATVAPDLVQSVSVVVGHAAAAIASFAAARPEPEIALVHNPSYEEINNWYSLLLALRALDRAGEAERVVVFNADLLAHPDWFMQFLCDSAGSAAESLIAVDTVRPLTDESMKVSLSNGDPDLLGRIGKVGVGDPVGEYVGMFMVRGTARDRLRTTLETYVGSDGAVDHWYEHAIGETAAEGVPWVVWSTPDSEWIEIDDEADYASALEMKGLR